MRNKLVTLLLLKCLQIIICGKRYFRKLRVRMILRNCSFLRRNRLSRTLSTCLSANGSHRPEITSEAAGADPAKNVVKHRLFIHNARGRRVLSGQCWNSQRGSLARVNHHENPEGGKHCTQKNYIKASHALEQRGTDHGRAAGTELFES